MAQPTNTYDSYDMNGIREDLANIIYMISPEDTPFFSKTRKTKATNTLHEWQTDSLRASAANAKLEGGTVTASARTPTTRLGNYTQIVNDAATISGTDEGLNKAGRGREMAREVFKLGKELRLDIEKALFANNARASGNSATAREMAGIPAWLTTNTQSGAGGADPTGDGTDARTDGTQVALTQAMVNTALQSNWQSGGKADVIYAGAVNVDAIAGFTGSNNQRNTIDKREISYAVDVYMTSFGTVEIIPSRESRARDMFVLQSDMWSIPVLRSFKTKDLPAAGDFESKMVLTELTLSCHNEAANSGVFDLTV